MNPLKAWTIRNALAAGIVAGLIAMILWPLYAASNDLLLPFLVALGITGFCGLSVLCITVFDLAVHRRRGARLVPIRVFDIALGLVLAVPSLIEIHALLPR
jgi:hypothetical protein